ncbi:MAG: HD-GYP domain-containing protein [Propionivibrio sp.]|nr:HD-GYP domain-containing protein [Propionivibrio sp.]
MNSPKSNPDNVAHQPVEAEFLRHGIFVTDLDRPWIGTPFPLQGFLIENDEQIAQLQQLCRIVYVDRRRSIGDQYAALVRERERRMPGHAEDDFLAIAKRIRAGRALPASQGKSPSGIDAGMEAEMLRSAPIIDDVQKTLEAVGISIEAGDAINLDKVFSLVNEMAAGVERNPDALIWLTRLMATDRYSYDHAVDVSVHLMVFGRFLGLGRDDVKELGRAGLMQDIGKVHVPSAILGKAGALTSEEFRVVQSHVASSLELLLGQPSFPNSLLSIVAEHHERYDGTGYPRSLAGDRIGLRSEMAGMVDTYCAMTRRRVFSEAVSSQKALELLSRMRGVKFREVIVDQFVQCVGLYPVGTLVELSTGEVGVVIQQNRIIRERPRLMVLMSAEKTLKRRPTYVDLMHAPKAEHGEPCRIVQALPSNAYGIDPAEFFLD